MDTDSSSSETSSTEDGAKSQASDTTEEEDDSVEDEQNANLLERRAQELEDQLAANKYLYEAHVELVDIYERLLDVTSLRDAYERFSLIFPLTTKLWRTWLNMERDLVLHSASEVEKVHVLNLYKRAVRDYQSIELWLDYLQYAIGVISEPDEMRALFERAINAVGTNVRDGRLIWDNYRIYEMSLLSIMTVTNSAKYDPAYDSQISRVIQLYKRQFSLPLLGMEVAYGEYADCCATNKLYARCDNEIAFRYKQSYNLLNGTLQPYEMLLANARNDDETRTRVYRDYVNCLTKQKRPTLATNVYDRAVSDLPLDATLWLDYLKHVRKLDVNVALSVSKRALRNCPSYLPLWMERFRVMEYTQMDYDCVTAEFERSLEWFANADEVADLWLAYLVYVRRNAKNSATSDESEQQDSDQIGESGVTSEQPTSTDEEPAAVSKGHENVHGITVNRLAKLHDQFAEAIVDGEAYCRVARFVAHVITALSAGDLTIPRQIYSEMTYRAANKRDVYLERITFERERGDAETVRDTIQKALRACRDDFATFSNIWLMYEHEVGTVDDVWRCLDKCDEIAKRLEEDNRKRAAKEKLGNGRPAPANERKRGKTGGVNGQPAKRSRQAYKATANENEETADRQSEAIGEEEEAANQKDDAAVGEKIDFDPQLTVFLSNLSLDSDVLSLKRIFPNAIKIHVPPNPRHRNCAYAYCSFATPEEVATALALDRQLTDAGGSCIYVSEYKRNRAERQQLTKKYSTACESNKVFVRGLPFSCGTKDVERLFEPYGAREVRLVTRPSDGKSRGFAYVDFEDKANVEKAIRALNGSVVNGRVISVAVSHPPAKQEVAKPAESQRINAPKKKLGGITSLIPRGVQLSMKKTGGTEVAVQKTNEDFRQMMEKHA